MRHLAGRISLGILAYSLRYETLIKVLGSLGFACLTAMCAISFRLWFTPVPITLQVLAVLLSGFVLGSRWGTIAQMEYLAMGAVGLPVFANWTGGVGVFAGPTGGYLFGFVLGAFLAGLAWERLGRFGLLAAVASGLVGVAGVYLPGVAWLAVWIAATGKETLCECLRSACVMGIVPFVWFDTLKAIIASTAVLATRSAVEAVKKTDA